jgi:hypothetical protein
MPQNFEAYASKLEACLKKRPKKKEAKVRGPLLIGGSSNPFPGGYLGVLLGENPSKHTSIHLHQSKLKVP